MVTVADACGTVLETLGTEPQRSAATGLPPGKRMTLSRRPETTDDEPFLRRLMVEIISAQLAASAWPQPLREQIVQSQSKVLLEGIRTSAAGAPGTISLEEDQPVGWYVVASREDEILLVNLMILADHRGKGIGSAIIQDLLAESDHSRKPLRLTVRAGNDGAIRLYERFGFQRLGGDEVNHLMERRPNIL
jgi:ribosomal protein S18 acetylase RimI-like enzyme